METAANRFPPAINPLPNTNLKKTPVPRECRGFEPAVENYRKNIGGLGLYLLS